MTNDAEKVFWHIRRYLRISDTANTPQVDTIIRQELETQSLAGQQISIGKIKARIHEEAQRVRYGLP